LLPSKKLLLWKEILVDLEYPDYKVVDEICQGFPLTGSAEPSTVFQKQVRPPSMSLQQLAGMARGLNMAVVASLENAEWQDTDDVVWQETMQEVDNGWLVEELSPDLIDTSLPRDSLFSKKTKRVSLMIFQFVVLIQLLE
jgi:hypothetical protein